MGEISNGGGQYHKYMKFLRLTNKDHAIVFRNVGGDDLEVMVHVGSDKDGPTHGGLMTMGLATNVFDQEFMDKIINQLAIDLSQPFIPPEDDE